MSFVDFTIPILGPHSSGAIFRLVPLRRLLLHRRAGDTMSSKEEC